MAPVDAKSFSTKNEFIILLKYNLEGKPVYICIFACYVLKYVGKNFTDFFVKYIY